MAEFPSDTPTTLEPVQLHERVHAIDVLRGFALFGILCVNMEFYTTPMAAMNSMTVYWKGWHDQVATGIIDFFFSGKFYVLFSFLFGLGMAIQVDRAAVRGRGFLWYHARRMFVLLAIGLVHAYLIWVGDILTLYAIVGLVMTVFLNRKPLTCLVWSIVSYGLPCLAIALIIGIVGIATFIPGVKESMLSDVSQDAGLVNERIANAVEVYGSGTVGEIIRFRAREVLSIYVPTLVLVAWVVFSLFLLGLFVGKKGYFRDLSTHRGFLRRARWWALALGLLANGAFVLGKFFLTWDDFALKLGSVLLAPAIGGPTLSFFYVSNILLLLTPAKPGEATVWQARLKPIALTGRMALTNYLMQSVLCNLVFYSYGMGYYAKIGPAGGLVVTVVIYAIEVLWSGCWMRYFRFGPMEWLWRTLTYGKLQPMRLAPAPA